jgi:DNA-binding MarR family transcriptional regulator
MTSADEELGIVDALAQLSFLVQAALAEIAARHELTVVQVRLLGVLRDREPTMNELGRVLGLDKSSISGLVDRAERRGLAARSVSPTDRRVFRVSITDRGRRLAQAGAEQFAAQVERLVAGLPAPDRELLRTLAARVVLAARPSDQPGG